MKRRLVSVPALLLAALLLLVTLPLWVVVSAVIDLVRGKFRLPTTRLLAFALAWAWLETCGVLTSFAWWMIGKSGDHRRHYALQRWWARNLLRALGFTCGVHVSVENAEALQPGPVLLFARHASLADSLVSAYVTTTIAGLNPRYVLKKELLADPCLDIVGRRLPNHFLDRGAADSTPELSALSALTAAMDESNVGVIFPEGTRANPVKRASALERIGKSDPARRDRLAGMRHLLPPRPAGAEAMLRGHSTCDVVFAWHVGFEGLDSFSGILRALSKPVPPVRFVMRRVSRSDIPAVSSEMMNASASATFVSWLDEQWSRMDREVDAALSERM